ncbi:IKI3-domain-containing protein [Calocera viscosa TUFC12733]|uniref:IKI3-domain-containing protein n=1 Tax=Calocera viscosa (strain TUFC12733) TaxID=1330018 RepID=A0A167N6R3_CALVF|nr:IKI3-domain-containing protein [Calocera viscosa TUFC12733]
MSEWMYSGCPIDVICESYGGFCRTDYRSAFLACRKHRIDLNVLVDHDTPRFMKDIPQFVEQVDDPDYVNLFLSGIGQSSQSAERKNEICDAIKVQLEQRDLNRYISSILTAHVVKSPSDIESGLKLLLRLRDENAEILEEAIKYIIFLVDVDCSTLPLECTTFHSSS